MEVLQVHRAQAIDLIIVLLCNNINMARAGTIHKGGRPKGKLLQKTIDRIKVLEQIRNRASSIAGSLLGAQALIAMGTHTLMRIDEDVSYRETGVDKSEAPKKSKYVTKKFSVVTDPDEIKTVFNTFEDIDGSGIVDGKYYFVTHKEPQNNAIESIFNRTWGRPTESIEVSGKDGIPLIINLAK